MSERDKLLSEAIAISKRAGVHTSGRKIRSDKGLSHKYTKSAEPIHKVHKSANPVQTYKRVLGKLIKNNQLNFDDNAYMQNIETKYDPVTHQRVQTYVEPERYRFNALRYLARYSPDEPASNDEVVFYYLNQRDVTYTAHDVVYLQSLDPYTNEELFCLIYHINECDIPFFDYDTWYEYYCLTPQDTFDYDFKFEFGAVPGSIEFHPEWSYIKEQRILNERTKRDEMHARKVWAGKIGAIKRR